MPQVVPWLSAKLCQEEGQSAFLTGRQECSFYFPSWTALCYFYFLLGKEHKEERADIGTF